MQEARNGTVSGTVFLKSSSVLWWMELPDSLLYFFIKHQEVKSKLTIYLFRKVDGANHLLNVRYLPGTITSGTAKIIHSQLHLLMGSKQGSVLWLKDVQQMGQFALHTRQISSYPVVALRWMQTQSHGIVLCGDNTLSVLDQNNIICTLSPRLLSCDAPLSLDATKTHFMQSTRTGHLILWAIPTNLQQCMDKSARLITECKAKMVREYNIDNDTTECKYLSITKTVPEFKGKDKIYGIVPTSIVTPSTAAQLCSAQFMGQLVFLLYRNAEYKLIAIGDKGKHAVIIQGGVGGVANSVAVFGKEECAIIAKDSGQVVKVTFNSQEQQKIRIQGMGAKVNNQVREIAVIAMRYILVRSDDRFMVTCSDIFFE